MKLRKSIALLTAFLSLTAFGNVGHADSVASFYKGKQVSIVVAARAGGRGARTERPRARRRRLRARYWCWVGRWRRGRGCISGRVSGLAGAA